jgi:superfamily II DNA or RNA helicase
VYVRFLPYQEAREFMHKQKLKNQKEWKDFSKSDRKPDDIPAAPHKVYKGKGWTNLGDWLGTGILAPKDRDYWPFEEASKYAHSSGITSAKQWFSASKDGKLPEGIPSDPAQKYKNEGWNGWGDWLGTGRIADQKKEYWDFQTARGFVHNLRLKDENEWYSFCKSGNKPPQLPAAVRKVYGKLWKGMGDWLGTYTIASQNREYLSFEEASEYVHLLGLKTRLEWRKFVKSGKLPKSIPADPANVYKGKGWKGMGDWLGTGRIAPKDVKSLPFEEARDYAHSLKLKSKTEWEKHCRAKKIPKGIPTHPDREYELSGWNGWGDWLGTGRIADQERGWSLQKVKELIKDLIKNNVIDEWSEDERYHLLTAKGVLNLRSNRFSRLLDDLVIGPKTIEQRKALEDFANSDDDENIPDVGDEKIPTVSTDKLAELVEEEGHTDPLDSEIIQTPQQILSQTEYLESICQDVELMQFFVNHFVYKKLWKRVFKEEQDQEQQRTIVDTARSQGLTGKKFHDTVVEKFLSEYDGMESLEMPEGYAYPKPPRIMQKYTAYRIKRDPYFCNLSGTGAGKTLSAILASRVIDSKMTLVVCPIDVVEQWATKEEVSITAIFPDSKVITGKKAFDAKYDENKHQYLVLNYDKFSQDDSQALILKLVKEKIDFVVLDEIQFIKRRHEEKKKESQRRNNLGVLLTQARKKNSQMKVIGMSATPVTNNLEEGKSLLQFVTGKMYEDLATRGTVQNAMSLHQKLSIISIREKPKYKSNVQVHDDLEVYADKPQNIRVRELKKNPLLIEQYLTEARIPEIIKKINGQTVIYTEYVTGIIQQLRKAVEDAGFTHAEYTGTDDSGLERFMNREVQVLIASRPVSVGVEGLQKVCNNLIINTLPWTHAQYEQLIGRLHRLGQYRDVVHVHIIKASMAGYAYDQNKWIRIEFKRSLADCAADGRVPTGVLQTKEQMQRELIKWLERLERNEISTFQRSNLNVEPSLLLATTTQRQHLRNRSEFSKLNNIFNNSKSKTIHEKIQRNPQFLVEYHEKLDEARKLWYFDPVNVIASKINELKWPANVIMNLVIGDFGCGRAKLAELLKENKMYNFDHHNIINDKIIACDMKSVPLREDGKLGAAVFCLSLMGENWPDYIAEAKRCLAKNGLLFIAETTKSLSARLSDLRDVVKEQGFEIYSDEERGDFTFIDARKL